MFVVGLNARGAAAFEDVGRQSGVGVGHRDERGSCVAGVLAQRVPERLTGRRRQEHRQPGESAKRALRRRAIDLILLCPLTHFRGTKKGRFRFPSAWVRRRTRDRLAARPAEEEPCEFEDVASRSW